MKKIFLILITVIGVNSLAAPIDPVAVACSPAVKGLADFGIGIVAEAFTEELPFFGPFGSLITGTVSDQLCPGDDGGVGARLDQVENDIAGLKDRMTAMQGQMDEISVNLKNNQFDMDKLLAAGLTEVYVNLYKANLKTFDDYYQAYIKLINSSGNYSSLKEYSQGYKGGFKALWNNSELFRYAISSSDDVVHNLQNIMPIGENGPTNAKDIMTNLNTMCRNITAMSDTTDVVGIRIKCNLVIQSVAMQIAYRTLQAREIMLDYIATVLAARSPKANGGAIDISQYPDLVNFNPMDGVKLADTALDLQHQPSALAVVKITNDYRKAVRNVFVGATNKNENMFPLYDGFDKAQLKSIANACTDPVKKVIGINQWYPNLVSQNPPYIVTSCPMKAQIAGAEIVPMATGIAYYKDVTKWNNILGVLVADNAQPDDSPEANDARVASIDSNQISSSDGKLLTNTKFSLTSNVPLEINSMAIATLGNGEAGATNLKQPDISFVQAGQYKPVFPAYSYYDLATSSSKIVNLADFNVSGTTNQTNQFLTPRVTGNTTSNMIFDSNIYGLVWMAADGLSGNQVSSLDFYGKVDVPNVYLSFKDDSSFTHIFGLKFAYFSGGEDGNTLSEAVTVRVVCLDIQTCKITGSDDVKKIATATWNNGASITISQPTKNGPMSLIANTKVNP